MDRKSPRRLSPEVALATAVALAVSNINRNVEFVDFDRPYQVEHWRVERSGELIDALSK